MFSSSLAVLALVAVSLAATPQGFEPASQTSLQVSFNGMDATDGKQIGKEASAKAPQLAVADKLTGTSFAVLMIDLDIPTNSPPKTNTLLHWMQTGLTQSAVAAAIAATNMTKTNTTGAGQAAVGLQIPGAVAAAAPYFGPNPPAKTPLTHRYTQILVDTSGAPQAAMTTLTTAAKTRMGFNALAVLTQAGLQDKVVAGNFFTVTNPGPAQARTVAAAEVEGQAKGSSITGSAVSQRASRLFAAVGLVAAAFFSL